MVTTDEWGNRGKGKGGKGNKPTYIFPGWPSSPIPVTHSPFYPLLVGLTIACFNKSSDDPRILTRKRV